MIDLNAVRAEMARKNITIKELAKKMKLSTNSLSRKLNSKTEFKVSEVSKIAKLLNVEVTIFFTSDVV